MSERKPRNIEDPDTLYRFFAMYAEDLMQGIASLLDAKGEPRLSIRNCLLRDAVIAYGRPFSGNRGPEGVPHRLEVDGVPEPMRALHDELIGLRDQLFAHTDLPRRNPKVTPVLGTINQVTYDGPNYDDLFARRDEMQSHFEYLHQALMRHMKVLSTSIHHDNPPLMGA